MEDTMKTKKNGKFLWAAFALLIAVGSAVEDGRSQQSRAEWRFENGPWTAGFVPDLAIGYKDGSSVVYAVSAGTIAKSTNQGESWQYIPGPYYPVTVDCERENPNVLFAGSYVEGHDGAFVYRSTNGGVTWENVTSNLDQPSVSCIAIQPGTNGQIVYLGCDGSMQPHGVGILWRTTDGGQSWSLVPGFPQTQAIISEILFNPSDHNEIFVSARDDYEDQNGGVWRSTDNGQTWLMRVQGMVSRSIGALAIDPVRPNRLYAGTQLFGAPAAQYLYSSSNSGDN